MRFIKLILILLCINANATIYYVSTSGSNANNGTSTSTPWQTLEFAEANATAPGDIIALKKGDTWSSATAIAIEHSGAEGNPITWDGSLWGTGANAIILSSATPTGNNVAKVNIIACDYVTFKKITINANNTVCYPLVIGGGVEFSGNTQNTETNIIIDGCAILNAGDGGATQCRGLLVRTENNNISDITIQNCTFDGSDDEQLSLYPSSSEFGGTPAEISNVLIKNNTLTNWGRRGTGTAYGIQVNNKITNCIIENNILVTGVDGEGNCMQIEHNEPTEGFFPTNITVQYNRFTTTKTNTWCIYIAEGRAITATISYNLFIQGNNLTDLNGGCALVSASSSPTWTGALIKFYNNTMYSMSGVTFDNGSAVSNTVEFKNNILYNTGTTADQQPCALLEVSGATIHNNNSYFKTAGANSLKVIDDNYSDYWYSNAEVVAYEATAVVTNPLLISVTDLRIQSGSPCINAGASLGFIRDIIGNPISGNPDMGAYEFTSATGVILRGKRIIIQ